MHRYVARAVGDWHAISDSEYWAYESCGINRGIYNMLGYSSIATIIDSEPFAVLTVIVWPI